MLAAQGVLVGPHGAALVKQSLTLVVKEVVVAGLMVVVVGEDAAQAPPYRQYILHSRRQCPPLQLAGQAES